MIFGNGLSFCVHDQDVRGLQVAMNDAFLMRVLDALADLHEELEASFDRQAVLVAVVGDRAAPGRTP